MIVDYHKVGFLLLRGDRILLCRKKQGTSLLILPGGCIEPGETMEMCLHRELREELGDVNLASCGFLGTYRETAAGSAGKVVQIELYEGNLDGYPTASAEITELVWFGPDDDREQLAPSIRNQVLPDLIRRGVIPWTR